MKAEMNVKWHLWANIDGHKKLIRHVKRVSLFQDLQVALVIYSFGIRGFDYLRMQKLQIAMGNGYF